MMQKMWNKNLIVQKTRYERRQNHRWGKTRAHFLHIVENTRHKTQAIEHSTKRLFSNVFFSFSFIQIYSCRTFNFRFCGWKSHQIFMRLLVSSSCLHEYFEQFPCFVCSVRLTWFVLYAIAGELPFCVSCDINIKRIPYTNSDIQNILCVFCMHRSGLWIWIKVLLIKILNKKLWTQEKSTANNKIIIP